MWSSLLFDLRVSNRSCLVGRAQVSFGTGARQETVNLQIKHAALHPRRGPCGGRRQRRRHRRESRLLL